ncbi:DUF3375 family protein [Antribacter gilvus]|uniref:DUF3375 family protein n=1 Tax=Antribacter gilvus TaxID=2304675 RepID=UPI0013DEE8A3|nr:DUF3375 family protein [Antribacter gilvus]
MSTLTAARDARRLAQEHPAWVLLRSRHAPVAVTLLARCLDDQARRLPERELVALLDDELDQLRHQDADLPSAGELVHEWLTDGVLVRRTVTRGTRGGAAEVVEPSEGALVALRFAAALDAPPPRATPTRVALVADGLRRVLAGTEPDRDARLAVLQAERGRIDAEIARVRDGDAPMLTPEEAAQQVRELLAVAAEVPAGLARAVAELERADDDLRSRLTEAQSGAATEAVRRDAVLDDLFRGVDHLAESAAGKAVAAVGKALRERAADLDPTPLLDAGRVGLSPAESAALRRLVPALEAATDDAAATLAALRRGLVRRLRADAPAAEQALHGLLRDTVQASLGTAETIPLGTPTALTLSLGAADPSTPAGLALHHPEDAEPAPPVVSHAGRGTGVDPAVLRELARASEIDVTELRAHVNDAVTRSGEVSVAQVLAQHPPSQGLASVVGLLVLAERHGRRAAGNEDVTWKTPAGPRRATVPRHLFEELVP